MPDPDGALMQNKATLSQLARGLTLTHRGEARVDSTVRLTTADYNVIHLRTLLTSE